MQSAVWRQCRHERNLAACLSVLQPKRGMFLKVRIALVNTSVPEKVAFISSGHHCVRCLNGAVVAHSTLLPRRCLSSFHQCIVPFRSRPARNGEAILWKRTVTASPTGLYRLCKCLPFKANETFEVLTIYHSPTEGYLVCLSWQQFFVSLSSSVRSKRSAGKVVCDL